EGAPSVWSGQHVPSLRLESVHGVHVAGPIDIVPQPVELFAQAKACRQPRCLSRVGQADIRNHKLGIVRIAVYRERFICRSKVRGAEVWDGMNANIVWDRARGIGTKVICNREEVRVFRPKSSPLDRMPREDLLRSVVVTEAGVYQRPQDGEP